MKHLIAALLTVITLISTLPSFGQNNSFSQAKTTKTATLSLIYNEEKGWAYENRQGEKVGILAEMMNAFRDYLTDNYGIDATLDYKFIEYEKWTEFQLMVEQGSVNTFGLSHMTITEERKKRFQFSQPFMNNIEVLISTNQLPTLRSMAEISTQFKGKASYCSKGSANLGYLQTIKADYFPELEIKLVGSDLDAINQMINDPAGGFTVVDFFRYLSLYKEGRPVKRHGVGDHVEGSFGISMPLSSDWKPVLDDFLETYLRSTEYRKSVGNNLDVSAVRLIEGL